MTVALDETRHNEASVQLHNLGFRPDIGGNLLVVADRRHLVAGHRHRLDDAERFVNGFDDAAAQYEVGGRDFRAGARCLRCRIAAAAGKYQARTRRERHIPWCYAHDPPLSMGKALELWHRPQPKSIA